MAHPGDFLGLRVSEQPVPLHSKLLDLLNQRLLKCKLNSVLTLYFRPTYISQQCLLPRKQVKTVYILSAVLTCSQHFPRTEPFYGYLIWLA